MHKLSLKINTFIKYPNFNLISVVLKYRKESIVWPNNSKLNFKIKKVPYKVKSLNLKFSSNYPK